MIFRKNPALKILSHPHIIPLNHYYRMQFLKIFFDELRTFLLPIHHYSQFHFIFSNNSNLLQQIQHFWLSLSHCSLTTESNENKKCYATAEKNMLDVYHGLHEFCQKFSINLVEKLFYSLHLVIQQYYPKEEIQKIPFSLPLKIVATIDKDFYPLKTMIKNPKHSVCIYENDTCKKEFRSLFFLYQKSDFSDEDIESLRKDVFLTNEKYPLADGERILDGFLNNVSAPV